MAETDIIKGGDLPETHPDYVALATSILTLLAVLLKWVADTYGNRKRSEIVQQQHQEILGEVKKNTDISLTAAAAAVEATGMPLDQLEQTDNAKYLKEQFDKYRAQRPSDADKEQETEESRRGTRKEQTD